MKKAVLIKWVILFLLVIFASCSKGDQCQEGGIDVLSLEDLGCPNSAFTVNVLTTKEFELIRNQDDFDALIESRCDPSIDWEQYDLIAGMVNLSKGLQGINKTLVMNCSTNRLILTIEIEQSATLNAPTISFNAVIPKLKDDQDFFVDVLIVN